MGLEETIIKHLHALSEPERAEVLNFVVCLRSKTEKQEDKDWSKFSLSSAMRGMEDKQTPYSLEDLKESFS